MKIAPQFIRAGETRHLSLDSRDSSSDARQSVNVHIEELVLYGFAPADRKRIAAAVEGELARLMGEERPLRWPQNPLAVEWLNGGVFNVTAGAKPRVAGTQIARAVFQSLRQQARASARALQNHPGQGGRPL